MANDLIRTFRKAIEAGTKNPSAYDIKAEVVRVEDNIAWVHIDGGVSETPVQMSISAKKGDIVRVRVSGKSAWIIGNATNPPTDDTTALVAKDDAVVAKNNAADAHEKAEDADHTAVKAKKTADSILLYDHSYTLRTVNGHLIADFQAHLYRGGIDIHESYSPELFTWYMKTEDGTEYLGNGYTVTVDTTTCGYGAEIIGKFTTTDDSEALTIDNDNLTDISGNNISVRSSGDAVRVRDLSVSTNIYPSEKLMVIGNEDEHLVTIETLTDYLGTQIDSDKHYKHNQTISSAIWDIVHNLGKYPSVSVVDSAGTAVVGDVEYISTNELIVTFGAAFKGEAYLN